jgi:hypothetical protein
MTCPQCGVRGPSALFSQKVATGTVAFLRLPELALNDGFDSLAPVGVLASERKLPLSQLDRDPLQFRHLFH